MILTFWAFYASLLADKTSMYLVPFGSLLLILACLRSGRIGLCAVLPRLAPWWVGLSALVTLAIYTPSPSPPEGSAYSFWAAAAALAGFLAVAFLGPAGSEDRRGRSGAANRLAR